MLARPASRSYMGDCLHGRLSSQVASLQWVKLLNRLPVTLAAKAHTTGGMTIDELCQHLNQECEQVGVDQPFVGPQPTLPVGRDVIDSNHPPQKFQVCTNYKKLNEVTQVLPMPQGDIRTKQQAVSGHRWISLLDFATGF